MKTETLKQKTIRLARARAKAAMKRALRDISVAQGIYEALNGRYETAGENEADWRRRNRMDDAVLALVENLRELTPRMKHRVMVEAKSINTRTYIDLSNDIIAAEPGPVNSCMTKPVPEDDAEMAFELRAAFGPGETVVNVLTGETRRT